MSRFEAVLFCESARWGDMDAAQTNRTTAFTKSEPAYLPDQLLGDWDRNTSYIANQWISQRRTYYLDSLQAVGLYLP